MNTPRVAVAMALCLGLSHRAVGFRPIMRLFGNMSRKASPISMVSMGDVSTAKRLNWKSYRATAAPVPHVVPPKSPPNDPYGPIADNYRVEDIGNTRLVEIPNLSSNPDVKIFVKCEFENPGKSIKDRIALHIVTEAERSGQLTKGGTVVAASSGNTGAAIALICKARGYNAKVITNTKCSQEKVDALKRYGAEAIVTRSGIPADHPEHYQNLEISMVEENPSYFGVNQYDNLLNPEAYYRTLGPEIYEQTGGKVTHLFAAASTGGTVSGIGRYLKEQNPDVKVVCADPIGSIFHEYWDSGNLIQPTSFEVEGVGKDSIPGAMDFSLIDEMPQYHDRDAFKMCRWLYETTGLLVGGSTGLNVLAAAEMADKIEGPATMVCIAPDAGEKYLSKIFNEGWLKEKSLI